MRHSSLILTALLGGALLPVIAARAQTTLDLHALDALPGGGSPPSAGTPSENATGAPVEAAHPAHPPKKPAKPKPSAAAKPKAQPPAEAVESAKPAKPTTAGPATPAPAPAPPPAAAIGPAPPPAPVIPPPLVAAPSHPAPPPVELPIAADAGTEAKSITGGLRVTFPKDGSNLTPETETALRDLAAQRKGDQEPVFNVFAYAAGVPEDPSTPRRLSLSRALAARSVLIAAGIPSTRIYVRALGASVTEGPADRVDVVLADGHPSATP